MMCEPKQPFRSGFVTLIGRPNVGKSTLMNVIVGQKIAIMSDKPQTTRNKIQGIYTSEQGQIVFIDTPGMHQPKTKLGHYMQRAAYDALKEVDLILFVVDVQEGYGPGEKYILEHLQNIKTPVFLVLNKIDLVHPEALLPVIDQYAKLFSFAEVIPLSARLGNNVNRLVEVMMGYLPEGPQYYPDDQITDHPERFVIAELIREKILELTREEVPHSVAVEIEQFKQREGGQIIDISALIYTERESQKKIIIGRQGAMLKQIGSRARKEVEALLGSKVFLQLWVKVRKDWRNQLNQLRQFGYDDRET